MKGERLKVGFISQWFDPETGAAAIPGVIARALGDDVDVEVLTGFPSYPQGRIYEGYQLKPYQHESLRGLSVHRVPMVPSHDDNPIRRGATWLSFALSASFAAPLVLKHCDVVLVHMTPATVALPAAVLRFVRRVPYVLHVEDLWPDTVLVSKQAPKFGRRVLEFLLHSFCDFVYKHAASIAVTSPGMIQKIHKRGIPDGHISLAPNWADEHVFRPAVLDPNLKEQLGLKAPFTVMYAGNLGQFQELDTLVAAAALLQKETRINFAIVGAGVVEERLRNSVSQYGLTNVVFLPPRAMSEMAEIMAIGDLHYIALCNEPLFEMTLPSKLQATMASGRAIVGGLRGDPAKIIQDSGAGVIVPVGDAQSLADAIQSFVDDPRAVVASGHAARKFYEQHLSQSEGTDVLHRMLRSAAGSAT